MERQPDLTNLFLVPKVKVRQNKIPGLEGYVQLGIRAQYKGQNPIYGYTSLEDRYKVALELFRDLSQRVGLPFVDIRDNSHNKANLLGEGFINISASFEADVILDDRGLERIKIDIDQEDVATRESIGKELRARIAKKT